MPKEVCVSHAGSHCSLEAVHGPIIRLYCTLSEDSATRESFIAQLRLPLRLDCRQLAAACPLRWLQ
jgi:hypothetical protein